MLLPSHKGVGSIVRGTHPTMRGRKYTIISQERDVGRSMQRMNEKQNGE